MGVPVSKIIRELLALNKNSYIWIAKGKGKGAFVPRFVSENFLILFILFTIRLIKLCASSIITTASSKIFFSKLLFK